MHMNSLVTYRCQIDNDVAHPSIRSWNQKTQLESSPGSYASRKQVRVMKTPLHPTFI